MATWIIYCLKDPRDGSVKYIGATRQTLPRRLSDHCGSAKSHPHISPARSTWINQIRLLGMYPLIEQIEIVEEVTWKSREQYWIAHYRQLTLGLLNITRGGAGALGMTHREDVKERMSRTHLNRETDHNRLIAEGKRKFGNGGKPGRSGYKGVRIVKRHRSPFVASAKIANRVIYIGSFATAERAAKARDKFIWETFQDATLLNFPELAKEYAKQSEPAAD